MSKLVLRSTLATRIARQSLNDRMNLCSKCEKPVSFEEDVCSVGSEIYHPKCFRCAECNKAIKPNEYMLQNGENTCFDCYNNNELRTCAKCGEMIQGESMLGLKFNGSKLFIGASGFQQNLCGLIALSYLSPIKCDSDAKQIF